MKIKNVKDLFPLNLQFFAEGDDSNNDESNNNEPDENEEDEPDDNEEESEEKNKKNDKNKSEKIFTQKQVTAMMAREKREGKKSMLSSLGFKDEEEAKKAVSLFRALMDSQKDDNEKNDEKNKKLQGEKDDAENRAKLAESKLECLSNGVNKDSIDDVLAIALPKVSDENSLEDVLKDMKKNKRYSIFFESDESENDGTGTPPAHNKKKGNGNVGIGKRLAESTKVETKKSSYF